MIRLLKAVDKTQLMIWKNSKFIAVGFRINIAIETNG